MLSYAAERQSLATLSLRALEELAQFFLVAVLLLWERLAAEDIGDKELCWCSGLEVTGEGVEALDLSA